MKTTDYLSHELRRARLSMHRAEKKPNTPESEMQGLRDKIACLEEALAAVQGRELAEKPLTWEQMRKMDGHCVKVEVGGNEPLEMLVLIEVVEDEDCVLLRNNLGGVSEYYSDDDLEEDGIKVYAYTPPHLDRNAWEPCIMCKTCENCKSNMTSEYKDPCFSCLKESENFCGMADFQPSGFCKYCGRPLTDAAWAELERKVYSD